MLLLIQILCAVALAAWSLVGIVLLIRKLKRRRRRVVLTREKLQEIDESVLHTHYLIDDRHDKIIEQLGVMCVIMRDILKETRELSDNEDGKADSLREHLEAIRVNLVQEISVRRGIVS